MVPYVRAESGGFAGRSCVCRVAVDVGWVDRAAGMRGGVADRVSDAASGADGVFVGGSASLRAFASRQAARGEGEACGGGEFRGAGLRGDGERAARDDHAGTDSAWDLRWGSSGDERNGRDGGHGRWIAGGGRGGWTRGAGRGRGEWCADGGEGAGAGVVGRRRGGC